MPILVIASAAFCCSANVFAQGWFNRSNSDDVSRIHYDEGVLKISLSSVVESAINSGVSLTFTCEYSVVREWLLMDWPEQVKTHEFVISRNALSDRYLVQEQDQTKPHIASSSAQSVAYMADRATRLFEQYRIAEPDTKIRIRLSKTELPGPIRLSAFASRSWDLNSGWTSWALEN